MGLSRHTRNTEDTDHNVLTIFLPILAVAIALCAGGCCYMEKRRKKRLKNVEGQQYLENDHISDTESISTITSSRYRPYMLPTPTTGRQFRSLSRAGSMRSIYDGDSSYGEPPPYSGRNSRRSSVASAKALEENSYKRRGIYNDGYESSSQRSLNRSKSMLDMREEMDLAPLRRTRSSNSLGRSNGYRNNYEDNDRHNYEYRANRQSRQVSPAQSEWSIRTAPQPFSYDPDYVSRRPSSVASLPVRGRRSNLKRSLSQPNLSRSSLNKTMTYPQGILKRNAASASDDGRSDYNDHGAKDLYADADSGRGSHQSSQVSEVRRSLSRMHSGYGIGGSQYEGYNNNYPTYRAMSQGGYDDPSYNASITGSSSQHYAANADWRAQQYPQNYDPYSYGGSTAGYWDNQTGAQSQPTNPYVYGSMIY